MGIFHFKDGCAIYLILEDILDEILHLDEDFFNSQ